MRLIDADKIYEKMRNTFDMQELYLPMHFQSLIIDEAPTVDAIPMSVIEDIKAEIDEKTEIHKDGEFYIKNIDVKRIIDKHIDPKGEDKGMYIACKKCKYNYDGECNFDDMGSGNEIDMPCYREKELIKKAADNFLQAFVGAE